MTRRFVVPVALPAILALSAGAIGQSSPSSQLAQPQSPSSTTPTTTQSPAPAAPQTPAPPSGPIIFAEAKFALDRELDKIKEASAIKGTTTSVWETHIDGYPPNRVEYVTEYIVQKPDKLFLETKDLKVYANGQTLTVYSKFLKHYVVRQMPAIWDLRQTIEDLTNGQIRSLPNEAVLRPGLTLEQSLRGVRSMETIRDGEWEGKPGFWITGTGVDDRQPAAIPFTLERWYPESTGVCEVIRQDWTRMYQDLADKKAAEDTEFEPPNVDGTKAYKRPQKYHHARWLTKLQRDFAPKVAPDAFSFIPGAQDRRVEKFVWSRPNLKEQVSLIGKPAPTIATRDFDDNVVDLQSFQGKVVVLDFWATWCGPCLQGMPAMHALMEKYKDRPVQFIAVNREYPMGGPQSVGKVKNFLKGKAFTMQQINDNIEDVTKSVSAAFQVASIPQVVIIDQQGMVQEVDVGYVAGKEKELEAKIEKLLSGQPLRTQEEMNALREQVGLLR